MKSYRVRCESELSGTLSQIGGHSQHVGIIIVLVIIIMIPECVFCTEEQRGAGTGSLHRPTATLVLCKKMTMHSAHVVYYCSTTNAAVVKWSAHLSSFRWIITVLSAASEHTVQLWFSCTWLVGMVCWRRRLVFSAKKFPAHFYLLGECATSF